MPKHLELDEILARNPQIGERELEKANKMLRELRDLGVRRKGYDLAPPFGGRRALAQDSLRPERSLSRRGDTCDCD